ncbi:hypothetical protein B1R94_16030 [Mycolicibacterium litorale]|nr:hypothetical protein B1R94_16030 [Mycolicibacterium litorale]
MVRESAGRCVRSGPAAGELLAAALFDPSSVLAHAAGWAQPIAAAKPRPTAPTPSQCTCIEASNVEGLR